MPSAPLEVTAKNIARVVLEQSKRANVGHIGCNLSVAHILAALYSNVLNISTPNDPNRDRFILSKGHAALGLYSTLYLKGWISTEQLNGFCSNGSALGVHPDHQISGVEYSTGSLGMGISFAAGAALAAKLKKQTHRIFTLVSDAECNEGSVWEAVMFASHHRLTNLTAIIDLNGQQAFGYCNQIMDLSPMAERWASFGWKTIEVDGHDVSQLTNALSEHADSTRPTVVLARTIFGKGVSFMEKTLKWHYFPLSDTDFKKAISEIEG